MLALTPVLHEVVPHGWSRWALLEPDGTIASGYAENPAAAALYRERLWRFTDDPVSPMSLWMPAFRAAGIGWTLHLQNRGWLDSPWCCEIEAPLDSCWLLDSMLADGGRTVGFVHLARPRSARPFTVEDVQRLDRLRPWLAHALHRRGFDERHENQGAAGSAGAPVMSGQILISCDKNIVFQTRGVEFLLRVLAGEPASYTRRMPARESLPAPILKLLQCIGAGGTGAPQAPPHRRMETPYGVIVLEAKWLLPAGVAVEDAAKDPQACLISVTMELREHAAAHAARVLRDSGATPAQVKVGVRLASGKAKRAIADELGIRLSSVMDLTKKLYQNLDIHNPAELGAKVWLGGSPSKTRLPPDWAIGANAVLGKSAASAGLR
jgi:hypothetical protein